MESTRELHVLRSVDNFPTALASSRAVRASASTMVGGRVGGVGVVGSVVSALTLTGT